MAKLRVHIGMTERTQPDYARRIFIPAVVMAVGLAGLDAGVTPRWADNFASADQVVQAHPGTLRVCSRLPSVPEYVPGAVLSVFIPRALPLLLTIGGVGAPFVLGPPILTSVDVLSVFGDPSQRALDALFAMALIVSPASQAIPSAAFFDAEGHADTLANATASVKEFSHR